MLVAVVVAMTFQSTSEAGCLQRLQSRPVVNKVSTVSKNLVQRTVQVLKQLRCR